jgi:hypothetical protein
LYSRRIEGIRACDEREEEEEEEEDEGAGTAAVMSFTSRRRIYVS